MYGGAGKHGRGGGRGGGAVPGKRSNNLPSSFHQPPPPHRPSSSGGRLSMGGAAAPRNRGPSCVATTSSAPSMADENFSLITGNPLNFAMIIRLAPDLVDEIKRVEAQGGSARIKFDANANNPSGNVIDVAGKNFRFTWSREIGDLCDIYEERQSGEDGDGLLVESGCAWRKLNVQRILDESTKNQVKKRSEEAERQLKSRKAIILDHGNPSMKNQMKALAAAETTPWRKPFKQKKESEFKKRKIETPPVAIGGPPRSVYKSGLPLTTSVTGRPSVSPSPPDQSGAPASPFITGSLTRGNISAEDVLPNQVTAKENAISSEKEKFNKTSSGALHEKPGRKGSVAAKSIDLQTMLISFLKENPKGMSLKALEKAVGDAVPNSIKKIEPIIKKIATFQAPGRYILKPGVELENMKKPSSECGSSPEVNGQQTPVAEEKHEDIPISMSNFAQKSSLIELEKQTLLNPSIGEDLNSFEKIDIQRHSPDLFGSKKVSDNSEGPAGSSSDSGSDSDSSDSGSDSGSHSRSKSRSPVKSGSGSSSDSDSDASSNSKQGPDEDVDIMTSDDEKDSKPKMQTPEPKFSTSPIQWRFSEGGNVENGIGEKEDVNDSDLVEIEKDLPDDFQETGMAVIDSLKDSTKPLGEYQENQVHTGFIFNEREKISNDGSKHEQSKNSERISKSKSKRGSDSKQPHEKSGHAKRLKAGSLPQQPLSQLRDPPLSVSPQRLSSDWVVEDPYKSRSSQMASRASNDGNADSGFQKGYNQGFSGKSSMDSQNSGRRPSDLSGRAIAPDTAEIPVVYPGSMESGIVRSVKNNQSHEGLPLQKDKVHSEVQDENCYNKEKKMSRNSTESSFGDKTPVTIGRGKILQRELSELELGEFREPLPEETSGGRRFERKSSFKESETKPSTLDYWNSELNKGKPTVKKTAEPVKPSPPQFRVGISSNIDTPSKKTPEQPEDLTRPSNRLSQPEGALHPIRADRTEIGTRKSVDVNGKLRHNEARVNQENGVDVLGDAYKKASVSVPQQHGIERGPVSYPKKESRTHKSNTCPEPSDIRKDTSLTESSEGVMKRRESSSDENSCSYSKYEKEEPELKGPIKDFSQYKEYVQEYREKYDSYCSLNKTLESYRNEFEKLGKDLEISKGTDMEKYYHILEQLKESYRQCGTRHKRLKKIFVVLHEELQHLKQMIKDYAVSYTME